MTSAASPSSDRTNRKKCMAMKVSFVRRVQPNLNVFKPTSYKDLERLQRVHRNNPRLVILGVLAPMPAATSPSSDRTNRKKPVATKGDFVRRVQPKRNVFKPTSYKDLDDPVITKRTPSIDSSDTGEEDIVSKRMGEVEYSPSSGDDNKEDNDDELQSCDDDNNEVDRRFRQVSG